MDLKNHELAEQDYMNGMKYKDIATKYGVTLNTVKSWKTRYKWDKKGVHTKKKSVRTQKIEEKRRKKTAAETVKQVLDNEELNDKQRLFCLYYSKSFNATRAYMKAYGCTYESALSRSYRVMKDPRIKSEIYRLKQAKMAKAMLEPEDIFARYMDIAFNNITDYLDFGREEIPIMTKSGPAEMEDPETGERKQLTKVVNAVRFHESDQVDGSLIQEVSQGKDGARIKLIDQLKALDWLSSHMNLATEEQKAKVQLLKAQKEKVIQESNVPEETEQPEHIQFYIPDNHRNEKR